MTDIEVTTEEEFDSVVGSIQNDSAPVVVLFTAPAWCIPCRRFEPHWKIASEDAELASVNFVRVNLGDSPEDTGTHWATARYNILGVPSIRYFERGREAVAIQSRAIIPLKKELLNLERA